MTRITLGQNQASLPSANPTQSYWLRDPSTALLGHRTTKDLPPQADVVVIGSGITGAFAARFLVESGRRVVMLEAREACWGATGRNGGHCQPNIYATPPHIAAFELRNYDFLRALAVDNSIPCDWASTAGVHAMYTENLVARAAANLEKLRASHPELASAATLVTPSSDRVGADGDGCKGSGTPTLESLRVLWARGAVVQRKAASLWPYRLVCWVIEELLRGESFNLQTNTPVTDLQAYGDSWIAHTPRGQIAARDVLVACNGYTSHIIPSFTDLIVPVRGQVASLCPEERNGKGALEHTYVFMAQPEGGPTMDDYLVQCKGGAHELVLGGGRALGLGKGFGVSSDEEIDPVISKHLRTNLNSVLSPPRDSNCPGEAKPEKKEEDKEAQMPASFEWTGIMGFSADGYPWVGPVPGSLGGGRGLWVCGGYTGHGMPVAALSARAVTGMMCRPGVEEVDLPPEFGITEERILKLRSGRSLSMEDYEELIYPL